MSNQNEDDETIFYINIFSIELFYHNINSMNIYINIVLYDYSIHIFIFLIILL